MKKIILFILFSIVCLNPTNTYSQADIVGGDDANIQDYPYMAALIGGGWGGGYAFCGASIINEYWILTAAHCMSGQSAITPQLELEQVLLTHKAVTLMMSHRLLLMKTIAVQQMEMT